jgi:hypothetical protein
MPSLANPNGTCPRNCSCSASSWMLPSNVQAIVCQVWTIRIRKRSPPRLLSSTGRKISPAQVHTGLLIASSLDTTVVMPSNDEGSPLDVDSTVLMPHVDLTVEDMPRMQVESSAVEEGPILTRSALKRLRVNQPQTTMTQYSMTHLKNNKTRKRTRKGSIPLQRSHLAVYSSSRISHVAGYSS